MSFRSSVLVAAVAVLGASELAPVGAQPQAPVRPRYSSFGNIFSPRPALGVQGAGAGNAPFINPIGPQVAGGQFGQGFVVPGQPLTGFGYPGQVNFGQTLPGAFAVNPQLPPTGVVGTFNNLGHWYPSGTGGTGGGLGHWYPNGLASGRGVLTGGGGGGYGGGAMVGGGGLARPGGSPLGTALGVGAAVNSFRR
ncbi:hypothetical protein R5W24_001182 [Gemmata sp. JC717]|uniref:hypothetical protein n=1 Tax=Gemmata algarum TaxID=2975278 RepID=UPI0021BA440B|nr:hypothetical protein [Gemmata algarum]MDY3552102.1 hypothetical protein [Gemmata algarum]